MSLPDDRYAWRAQAKINALPLFQSILFHSFVLEVCLVVAVIAASSLSHPLLPLSASLVGNHHRSRAAAANVSPALANE